MNPVIQCHLKPILRFNVLSWKKGLIHSVYCTAGFEGLRVVVSTTTLLLLLKCNKYEN